MIETAKTDLESLGRDAAREVVGAEAFEQVEVFTGEDSLDRPIYIFSFLINPERAGLRLGLIYLRILQRLQDMLAARGDEHPPHVRLLDRADWPHRARA